MCKRLESWNEILNEFQVDEQILDLNLKNIDPYVLLKTQKLSEKFIEKHMNDDMSIKLICTYQDLSEKFIIKHKDKLNWNSLCHKYDFSYDFLEKYSNYVQWNVLSSKAKTIEFISRFKDRIHFDLIDYRVLNETFITTNKGRQYDWSKVIKNVSLSNEFLTNNYKLFDMIDILKYQQIDRNFFMDHIEDIYKHKLEFHKWLNQHVEYIFEDFISANFNKFKDLEIIYSQRKLSHDFIEKHMNEKNEIYMLAYQDLLPTDVGLINLKKYTCKYNKQDDCLYFTNMLTYDMFTISYDNFRAKWALKKVCG
jgi:hypothetical protein